jgi:hypothetical protein
MCIKRFDFDNAMECIKSHAPHAHAVIEKYVDQLDNERAELYVSLLLLANSIPMDVLRMKAGNASLDMEIAENAMNDARSLLERSK